MLTCLSRGSAAVLAAVLLCAAEAPAQIVEHREGDANPMAAVFKSTMYGGGAGALLGLAVSLVDEGDDGEPVKWGFVAGTFFGFGYGLYHVSTRPSPRAFLERGPGEWVLAFPGVEPDPHHPGARVRLATFRF
ncbi:MAG: hypothetical protein ACT4PE_10355 [Candidatus Eiseniibacteriota bacterium]